MHLVGFIIRTFLCYSVETRNINICHKIQKRICQYNFNGLKDIDITKNKHLTAQLHKHTKEKAKNKF
jgi:hypothetical protein